MVWMETSWEVRTHSQAEPHATHLHHPSPFHPFPFHPHLSPLFFASRGVVPLLQESKRLCFRGMEKGATGDWQHPVGGIEEEEDDEEDDEEGEDEGAGGGGGGANGEVKAAVKKKKKAKKAGGGGMSKHSLHARSPMQWQGVPAPALHIATLSLSL